MFTIRKEFSFCAGHYLKGLPTEHPCNRVHGHNYKVIVELQSKHMNDAGMVVDYRRLNCLKEYLDKEYDHRMLNDRTEYYGTTPTNSPTAENIARMLFYFFAKILKDMNVTNDDVVLKSVIVKETDKTSATYTP